MSEDTDASLRIADLYSAAAAAEKIVVFVHFADDLICSLNSLASRHEVLKIALVNRNMITECPGIESKLHLFNFVIFYDGPDCGNLTYGNGDFAEQKGKTNRVVPSVYDAVSEFLNKILPFVRDRKSLYLMTLSEELLIQVALLREQFDLQPAMSAEMCETFVTKPMMKAAFRENGVNCADDVIVDTRFLRNLHPSALEKFSLGCLPKMPVFVKPTAAAGSFETQTISSIRDFFEWVQKSDSLTNRLFLVEELLYQPYRLAEFLITESGFKILTVAEGFGDATYASELETGEGAITRFLHPSETAFQETGMLGIQAISSVANEDNLGSYFVEFMHKADGSLAVLEMAARTPAGCCEGLAVELLTGVDMEAFGILAPFIREPTIQDVAPLEYAFVMNVCAKKDGIVVKYNDVDPKLVMEGVVITGVEKMFTEGDPIKKIPSTIYEVALVMLVAGNDKIAVEATVENIREFYDPVEVAETSEE